MDLVLTNIDDHISNAGSAIGSSDYGTITFNINLHPITEDGKFKRYLYDKGKYKEMNKYPKQAINIYTSDDTDCIWQAIKTNMMKDMKDFIPTIDLHCNMAKGNTPLNKEIHAKVKKQRCWKRYLETIHPQKYKEYCRVRNQVRRMTRKTKISYEKDIASDGKSNPKKIWSYAKRTSYKQGISHLCCNDEGKNILTTSDHEKVQMLSNFFKSAFMVENPSNIPPMVVRCHTSITTLNIKEKMIFTKLTNLNISKSPGPDSIHPRILKECADS